MLAGVRLNIAVHIHVHIGIEAHNESSAIHIVSQFQRKKLSLKLLTMYITGFESVIYIHVPPVHINACTHTNELTVCFESCRA